MSHCLSWKSLQAEWWMVACHASHTCARSHPAIRAMCNCAACHALCLSYLVLVMPCACTYLTGCSNLASHSPSLRAALIFIISYNTLYWKPTSIQMIENIPLTSLVDICILLKERASQETDFSPAIPCYHTRFQEHTWMWEAPWAPSRNIDKALKRRASA